MPGRKCVVKDCKAKTPDGKNYQVMAFPSTLHLRHQWKELLKKPRRWKPKNNSGVCCVHFTKDAFIKQKGSRGRRRKLKYLKPDALPVLLG